MSKQQKPKITAKQEGGDDGYCYVVRIDGREFVSGLTRSQVAYYKMQALRHWQEQQNSTEMEERILRELERTHQYLVCDYHTIQGEDGPVDSLMGEDIQDLVGDRFCDSIDSIDPQCDVEARRAFGAMSGEKQDELLEKAFPSKRKYEV